MLNSFPVTISLISSSSCNNPFDHQTTANNYFEKKGKTDIIASRLLL